MINSHSMKNFLNLNLSSIFETHIVEKITQAKCLDNITWKISQSGHMIPLIVDASQNIVPLHSLYDPEKEAKRLPQYKTEGFFVFYGLGAGHHIKTFLSKDDALEKYLSGEYGVNELLFNRANAFVSFNAVIHDSLLEAAISVLKRSNELTDLNLAYVSEAINFSKLKKFDINNLYGIKKGFFTFDFLKAQKNNYKIDPTLITSVRREYVFKYQDSDVHKIKSIIGDEDMNMKRLGKLYQRHNMMEVNRGFEI